MLASLLNALFHYRNTTPKMPRTINSHNLAGARSPTPVSSPDDNCGVGKTGSGVVLSDDENTDVTIDMDTSMVSLSGRSTRSLKKILGKIKRSNSGGFESERARSQAASVKDSNEPFVRGNARATVNGRLGWTNNITSGGSLISNLKKKRFSEWSVDMLCTWLETMGLGQYTGIMKLS